MMASSGGVNLSGNVSDDERRLYLATLQEQTTRMMVPAMVFLILLAVVGLLGNTLVLVVYSKNYQLTTTRVFIMSIAVFDLLTNVLAIPGEIYDMFHRWDFDIPVLCGARLSFNVFTISCSALLLVAVAATRYRYVCHPHGKQTSVRCAKLSCAAITVVAIVCAFPCAILNGRQTKKTPRPDVTGYACTINDRYVKTIWPKVYMGTFIVGFLICCTSMIVLYIRIGLQAWRHRFITGRTSNYRSKHSSFSTGGKTTSESDADDSNIIRRGSVRDRVMSIFRGRNEKRSPTWVKYVETEMEHYTEPRTETTPDRSFEQNEIEMVEKKDGAKCGSSSSESNLQRKVSFSPKEVSGKSASEPNESGIDDEELSAKAHEDGCNGQDITIIDEVNVSSDMNYLEKGFDSRETSACPEHIRGSDENSIIARNFDQTELKVNTLSPISEDSSENSHSHGEMSFNRNNQHNSQVAKGWRENSVVISTDDTSSGKARKSDKVVSRLNSCWGSFSRDKSCRKDEKASNQKASKGRRSMTRTTTMLIAISAVYIIGFVPHLALIFFRYTSPRVFGNMTFTGFCFYNSFLRFHFLNSASNAIIYSICDKNFRERAWKILKCFRRWYD